MKTPVRITWIDAATEVKYWNLPHEVAVTDGVLCYTVGYVLQRGRGKGKGHQVLESP
jgi:hypothetical protein